MTDAHQKTVLIREALQTLRSAHAIDERDSLDAASLLAWYDQTIPGVTDIKILAGAMEIELMQRRGERIAAEGERRGGDQKSEAIKVEQRTTLKKKKRDQRHTARTLASEPGAVSAYVQTEAKAGRVPSVRGAVRAARTSRALRAVTPKKKRQSRSETPLLSFANSIRAEVRRRIDQVSHQSLTLDELAQRWHVHTDIARRYLREAALLGEVTKNGQHFTITPTPGMVTLETYKQYLHAEIVERRKEARDGYHKWRPDNVHTFKQSALLDWIEEELRTWPAVQKDAKA